jgi:hypothetical protein
MRYQERYPPGSKVKIVDTQQLATFRRTWAFHDPLQDSQLAFAGHTAVVGTVGFYHGGDALYKLRDLPGVWHECCLEAINSS